MFQGNSAAHPQDKNVTKFLAKIASKYHKNSAQVFLDSSVGRCKGRCHDKSALTILNSSAALSPCSNAHQFQDNSVNQYQEESRDRDVSEFQDKNAGRFRSKFLNNNARMFQGNNAIPYQGNSVKVFQDSSAVRHRLKTVAVFQDSKKNNNVETSRVNSALLPTHPSVKQLLMKNVFLFASLYIGAKSAQGPPHQVLLSQAIHMVLQHPVDRAHQRLEVILAHQ